MPVPWTGDTNVHTCLHSNTHQARRAFLLLAVIPAARTRAAGPPAGPRNTPTLPAVQRPRPTAAVSSCRSNASTTITPTCTHSMPCPRISCCCTCTQHAGLLTQLPAPSWAWANPATRTPQQPTPWCTRTPAECCGLQREGRARALAVWLRGRRDDWLHVCPHVGFEEGPESGCTQRPLKVSRFVAAEGVQVFPAAYRAQGSTQVFTSHGVQKGPGSSHAIFVCSTTHEECINPYQGIEFIQQERRATPCQRFMMILKCVLHAHGTCTEVGKFEFKVVVSGTATMSNHVQHRSFRHCSQMVKLSWRIFLSRLLLQMSGRLVRKKGYPGFPLGTSGSLQHLETPFSVHIVSELKDTRRLKTRWARHTQSVPRVGLDATLGGYLSYLTLSLMMSGFCRT